MILLDTNVVSELMRPTPDAAVVRWLRVRRRSELATSAITEAELRVGAARLPAGRRKLALQSGIERLLQSVFDMRILPFDSAAARHYADIVVAKRRAGRPVAQLDAQIAAIAGARGLPLATRNLTDFEGCGLTLVDPWSV